SEDLATINPGVDRLVVLLNNGDGTFRGADSYELGIAVALMAAGDFDRDGHLDLVGTHWRADQVSVLRGNGDGTFQAPLNSDAGPSPSGLAVGDFNADGYPDLVVVNRTSNSVSVLLNDGDWPTGPGRGGASPALVRASALGAAPADEFFAVRSRG